MTHYNVSNHKMWTSNWDTAEGHLFIAMSEIDIICSDWVKASFACAAPRQSWGSLLSWSTQIWAPLKVLYLVEPKWCGHWHSRYVIWPTEFPVNDFFKKRLLLSDKTVSCQQLVKKWDGLIYVFSSVSVMRDCSVCTVAIVSLFAHLHLSWPSKPWPNWSIWMWGSCSSGTTSLCSHLSVGCSSVSPMAETHSHRFIH